MIEINWHPSRRELHQFTVLLPLFVVVFALLFFRWTGVEVICTVTAAAVAVGVLGWFVPQLVKPLYVGWMILAFPIGWTVSHLILICAFFFIMTPIGWIVRCALGDPMKRRFERASTTYWQQRTANHDPAGYFRQF